MPRTDIPMSAADELAKAVLAFKQSEKGAHDTLVSLIAGPATSSRDGLRRGGQRRRIRP